MSNDEAGFTCPACGYPHLAEPPRSESGGGSYEICPSCGFEYGVTDDDRGITYDEWRRMWIDRGMPWDSDGTEAPPPDWDPQRQLRSLLLSINPSWGAMRPRYPTEQKVYDLLLSVADRIPAEKRYDVSDYLDHREWGLAIDILADALDVADAELSGHEWTMFSAALAMMNEPEASYSFLRPRKKAGPEHADLIAHLRAAGCVFAEDEAAVLLDAAKDGAELERMVRARVTGKPLEYVVGFADFCGVRVPLDPGVFIPRQRTAALVRIAAALAPPSAAVLDLCCGSGALGLAFAQLRPDAEVHAADVDPRAVANARRNLPRVYEGDLFEPIPDRLRFDVILANVPYVPTGELDLMPVEAREHEPVATHDGGTDGLDVLRRVLAGAQPWLRPGGHVLFEVSDAQRPALAGLRFETADDTTVAIARY